MKATSSFFVLFFCITGLFGQDVPELVPLDGDSELKTWITENGYYGRLLELQGQNKEALEYYRRTPGTSVEAHRRIRLLEWYMGFSDAPADIPGAAGVLFFYVTTGNEAGLTELGERYPGSFEHYGYRTGSLFIPPWLFKAPPVPVPEVKPALVSPPVVQESAPVEDDIHGVLVQLGSFKNRENAEAHLAFLKEKGITAFIQQKSRPEGIYHITVMHPEDDVQFTLHALKEKGVEGFPLYP